MEDRILNPQVPFPECVVLYVEDDDATAYLFHRALVESGTRVHVFRVRDGEEAIAFLIRDRLYHDAPLGMEGTVRVVLGLRLGTRS